MAYTPNNAGNVSAGKPKVGGAIFTAPLGTPLPKDAKSELDSAFENVGYISEDGLTNANSPETDAIKAWGGDIVYNAQTEKDDTFKFSMIEVANANVLKVVYGDDNVSGDLASGITVRANSEIQEERAYVFDMVLRGTILKRVVVARGQVTEVGDIEYTDGDLVGYETTISAHPDEALGYDTHREYIVNSEGGGSE